MTISLPLAGIPLSADLVAEPALFHGRSGYGFVTLARAMNAPAPPAPAASRPGIPIKPKRLWRERHYHVTQVSKALPAVVGSVDTYISQASFRKFKNGRKASNLSRVAALFSDLDTYKMPELRDYTPEQLAELVVQECIDCGLPRPSVIIDSGNGLYAKWILGRSVPEAALTRWKLVQRELCKRLARFNADPRACDAARVLRAIGSINGRTGRQVRVIWQHDAAIDDHGGHREEGVPIILYSFDLIADEILRETREQAREAIAKRRAAREAAKAAGDKRNLSGLRRFSPQQLASDRYDDIQQLLRLRGWQAGAPPGERDMPTFVSAALLALMQPLSELRRAVPELGARITPTWSDRQVQGCVHSVLDRAERSVRGLASVWNGYEVDPRYTLSNAWLIDALQITPEEQRQLKTIISDVEARRRDAGRAIAKRRAAGAQPRAEFLAAARTRREQAQTLRETGLGWADVGAHLGVSAGAARALAARSKPEAHRSVRMSVNGGPVILAAAAAPAISPSSLDRILVSADDLIHVGAEPNPCGGLFRDVADLEARCAPIPLRGTG